MFRLAHIELYRRGRTLNFGLPRARISVRPVGGCRGNEGSRYKRQRHSIQRSETSEKPFINQSRETAGKCGLCYAVVPDSGLAFRRLPGASYGKGEVRTGGFYEVGLTTDARQGAPN